MQKMKAQVLISCYIELLTEGCMYSMRRLYFDLQKE